jgi:hypothetical protein
VHLPRAFGSPQVWQAPVQALSQQTPSTQNPEPHWPLFWQSCPGPNLPQLPSLQAVPGAQSESTVQLWRQLPRAQVDGAQPMATPTMQVPSPSHTLAGTSWPGPSQAESLHRVPGACFAQPPRPLQRPLCPQVSGESRRQIPCGSTSPSTTGAHCPRLSASLQLTQAPVQATLQQTPSTQKPDMHWEVSWQTTPVARLPPQALPEQQIPSRQVPVVQSPSQPHG